MNVSEKKDLDFYQKNPKGIYIAHKGTQEKEKKPSITEFFPNQNPGNSSTLGTKFTFEELHTMGIVGPIAEAVKNGQMTIEEALGENKNAPLSHERCKPSKNPEKRPSVIDFFQQNTNNN
jgi:hypothetical protein